MRLEKVFPRKVVRHRADTWNALMTMLAEWEQRRNQGGALALSAGGEPDYVMVKNSSGQDVPQFGVLGIDNVVFTPTAAEAEFRSNPMVVGVVPADDTHFSRFVICIEPVADGKFGKAILSGLTVVKITVSDEDHGYADIVDGSVAMLESCDRGAAQVLWKETGTGTKWAVVRLGVPPSPFDVVRFSGVCKIDEANPGEKYPGSNTAYNQADQFGNPKPGEREWLLVKCERPFRSSMDADPGQEAHFPMELSVGMGGGSKYWWEYYLITQDFEVEGDDCATWNTKPTMEWGTDGLIDSNFGLSATLSSAERHLSCCYPGFGYERTVYGICLRPYLWYLGGTSSNSTHEIDYRKWLIRL